jgi:hypothetical protein
MPNTPQFDRKARLPVCSVCNEPVELEKSKTDEKGKAIHEECYIRKMQGERGKPPPKAEEL